MEDKYHGLKEEVEKISPNFVLHEPRMRKRDDKIWSLSLRTSPLLLCPGAPKAQRPL
jgi:hypothetical protein